MKTAKQLNRAIDTLILATQTYQNWFADNHELDDYAAIETCMDDFQKIYGQLYGCTQTLSADFSIAELEQFEQGLLNSASVQLYNLKALMEKVETYISYHQQKKLRLANSLIRNKLFKQNTVYANAYHDGQIQIHTDILQTCRQQQQDLSEHFYLHVENKVARLKTIAQENAWQTELQRIEEREAAKYRGQSKGIAHLYKAQVELMLEYKRQGARIDQEMFAMREKLISLESQENKIMLTELLNTLNEL
jgi:hypothetical protein